MGGRGVRSTRRISAHAREAAVLQSLRRRARAIEEQPVGDQAQQFHRILKYLCIDVSM